MNGALADPGRSIIRDASENRVIPAEAGMTKTIIYNGTR